MAIPANIQAFLDENQVEFRHRTHPPAFTARELAHVDHVPERRVAKTVVFLADGAFAMAVLPADERVDIERLRVALGSKDLRLATEDELKKLFPDCETGAMPPFGKLYGLPVYVDKRLAKQELLEFNAGSHRDEIRMSYHEFARVVEPLVTPFGDIVVA